MKINRAQGSIIEIWRGPQVRQSSDAAQGEETGGVGVFRGGALSPVPCPLSGLTQFVDVRHQSAPGLQVLSSEAVHGKQDNRWQVKPEQGNQKLHLRSWYYLSFSTLENT